jgi:uncharacterized membrane protein YedE/YeeE
MGGILLGAILFGSGLAVLGYCPGTSVAAAGEGHPDALAGVAGMIAGAFTFVVGFPTFSGLQKAVVDWGKITLPEATHSAPAIWIIGLVTVVAIAYAFTKLRRRPSTAH